jgi:hypothetical protein
VVRLAVCCCAWRTPEKCSVECVDDSIVINSIGSWFLDLFNHSGQFPSVTRCNHFPTWPWERYSLPRQLHQTNSRARHGTLAAALGDSESNTKTFSRNLDDVNLVRRMKLRALPLRASTSSVASLSARKNSVNFAQLNTVATTTLVSWPPNHFFYQRLFARSLTSKKLARSRKTARASLLKVPSPRCAAQLEREATSMPVAALGAQGRGNVVARRRGGTVLRMNPIADFRCSCERPEGARGPFAPAPNRRQPAVPDDRAHKSAGPTNR